MDRLGALPAITKFTSITIIVGDSNGRQPYLYIEKIVGGVNFCLGLRVEAAINQYVPVSAFQKDIKELTDKHTICNKSHSIRNGIAAYNNRLTFVFNKEKLNKANKSESDLLFPMREFAKENGIKETSIGVFEIDGNDAFALLGGFVADITDEDHSYVTFLDKWELDVGGNY